MGRGEAAKKHTGEILGCHGDKYSGMLHCIVCKKSIYSPIFVKNIIGDLYTS
jgi:hypothetical protein